MKQFRKTYLKINWMRFFLWSLLIFTVAGVLGRLALRTSLVHSWAQNKIIEVAGESLNARISMKALSGDLWHKIYLDDLTLEGEGTQIFIDEVELSYRLWSYFSGNFEIQNLNIQGFDAQIQESGDGSFPVSGIVKEADNGASSDPMGIKIDDLEFGRSAITLEAPGLLPDSVLRIQDLKLKGAFYQKSTMGVSVEELAFVIEEGRLPEPIRVSGSAEYEDKQVNLERLFIETGRSVISASAKGGLDDQSLEASLSSEPLNLEDVASFIDFDLLQEDLDINLGISGRLDSLELELRANARALSNILIVSTLDLSGQPTMTQFGVTGDYLNLSALTKGEVDFETGLFRSSVDGTIRSDIRETDITWGFDTNFLRYNEYSLRRFFGSGIFSKDIFNANLDLRSGMGDHIILNVSGENTFADTVSWVAGAKISDLDISEWFPETELNTDLNIRAHAEGKGLKPSNQKWHFGFSQEIDVKFVDRKMETTSLPNEINGQVFNSVLLKGELDQNQISTEGYFTIDGSRLDFSMEAEDYLQSPEFSYSARARDFDLSTINSLNDFPTRLTGNIEGKGSGSSVEDLEMEGRVLISNSIVNTAHISEVINSFSFKEGIMEITEGSLKSDIADGSFEGRKNLEDPSDTENRLIAELNLKDIQPLAPLFDVEVLQAFGILNATVSQNSSGVLQYDADLGLTEIIYDDLLTADQITGNALITATTYNEFDIQLDIIQPVVAGLTFQDIGLESEGIADGDSLSGVFLLDITGSERGRILQQGEYRVNPERQTGEVQLSRFDFITPQRILALDQPFRFQFKESSVSTDTLMLSSKEGAYFNMSVPYADSLNQQAWMEGVNFNFGLLQSILFDEVFVDGILSGAAVFNRSVNSLESQGSVVINRMAYRGVETDALNLNFDLKDERLRVHGVVEWDGEQRIIGDLDVPFVLEDPDQLDDEFFNRPVSGTLEIKPTRLSRFQNLLEDFGIVGTEGIVSFNGSVDGVAGRPGLEGRLSLQDPTLSGIKIDSAFASFSYDNENEVLQIDSEVTAARQKAADISARIPVSYDFRIFELKTREENDNLSINVLTEDFNLSVLNDFLNPEYTRSLKGTLNGDLNITGSLSGLMPSGYLRLTNGEVIIPATGIRLENIRSDMEFTSEGLRVQQLSARSGRGQMTSSGLIGLNGINPSTINLNLNASQFRLANTNDLNMVIDARTTLSGNATRPKATGSFSILNGFVYLDNFGDSNIEEVELEGEETSRFSPYDSLAMEMTLTVGENFFVRNRGYLDMEIELAGELEALKETKGELSLFGSLSGTAGYLRPLGKRFELQEADLLYSGPIDNPDLSVRSMYIPQTAQKEGQIYRLFYVVEGSFQEPEFRFESQPDMEESDIICFTLFNMACNMLESWQSVFVSGSESEGGASPTQLLTGVLLDEVEQIARQRLGIDVVQIDNIRVGTEAGTSIKAGWYLNRRTFFAIINEFTKSTPRRLFILEYILSENTDLVVTQGDDPREGLDVRWKFDY